MSFKIYGNEYIKKTLTSMISSGRLSQVFLLYGNAGLGKKTIARYMAGRILCENDNGEPCGECKSCKTILSGNHPDVITISKENDSKAFSVENLRELNISSRISANNGDRKVYIIADCDSMTPLSQNVFLKLIEDTPPNVFFIFTASSKAVFLPTILSRVISLGVCEVSESDTREALLSNPEATDTQISDALEAFSGNIGLCKGYFLDDKLSNAVAIAHDIADKLSAVSEYDLLYSFSKIGNDKELFRVVINLLCEIIRDASVIKIGGENLVGCYKNGSNAISKRFSTSQCNEIYLALGEVHKRLDSNANMALTEASVCAKIKNII